MVAGIATERNCPNAGGVRNELDYNNRADFPQRLGRVFIGRAKCREKTKTPLMLTDLRG
jgi:hypothetical protein